MQPFTDSNNPTMEFMPWQLLSEADLKGISGLLSEPRKIAITTHHKPDADALGSSLALALYLRKKGHTAHVVTPSDYPGFLNWMPGESSVLVYDESKPWEHLKALFLEADVVFCLDFNSLSRINTLGDWVRETTAHSSPATTCSWMRPRTPLRCSSTSSASRPTPC
jgi:hypothetical protein